MHTETKVEFKNIACKLIYTIFYVLEWYSVQSINETNIVALQYSAVAYNNT